MKKKKIIPRIILILLIVIFTAAIGYFAYVMLSYHRLGDQKLQAEGTAQREAVPVNTEQTLLSWNIGFGAYEQDYTFFMDGGRESWARSEEGLKRNLADISGRIASYDADFINLQEVDVGGTRTYYVNEAELLTEAARLQRPYCAVFAQNYDSPYLFYPFYQPHGKNRSGLLTLSSCKVTSCLRRSLPVEDSLTKLLDLDRCYSVSHIPASDGRELALFNFHLSAYTSDGTIADEQVELLLAEMQQEYEKGNYVIASGDFNKDLIEGGSASLFGTDRRQSTWAQPIKREAFDGKNLRLVPPLEPAAEHPTPTCRDCDEPYTENSFVITVDGFVVSDNVEVLYADALDERFECSDHNPVLMRFALKSE